jgi:fucose permease
MARNPELIRWIGLQQSADLMMDIFIEFLPLYLVDVMKLSAAQVGLLLGAYILIALLSDIVLIPLLERVPGRLVVRISSSMAAILYIAWLLSPWLLVKVILLLCLSLAKIGWYPVLAGETYAVAPGRSGTVLALDSIGGLTAGGLRWLVGWVANLAGLPTAMWLLLLAPVSLILFVPKPARREPDLYKT